MLKRLINKFNLFYYFKIKSMFLGKQKSLNNINTHFHLIFSTRQANYRQTFANEGFCNRESDSSRCSRYNSYFSCPAIHFAVLFIFRDLHTIVTRVTFTGLNELTQFSPILTKCWICYISL